jgi:hypothetical protein
MVGCWRPSFYLAKYESLPEAAPMPIRAKCPSCKAVLNIPDDVAGHVVQCTGCTATFTAPAVATPMMARPVVAKPAPAAARFGARTSNRFDDLDDPVRTRRRRRDDDDSDLDDRPNRKKKSRKKGESILPFVLAVGGLILVVLIGLGFGAYYLFIKNSNNAAKSGGAVPVQSGPPQGNNAGGQPAPQGGNLFTINSARKSMGRMPLDTGVDIEFTAHPGAGPMYTLVVQMGEDSFIYDLKPFETTPGQHRLSLRLNAFGPRFGRMGGGGGAMEVWVEERQFGAFGGGGRIVSNKLTVN